MFLVFDDVVVVCSFLFEPAKLTYQLFVIYIVAVIDYGIEIVISYYLLLYIYEHQSCDYHDSNNIKIIIEVHTRFKSEFLLDLSYLLEPTR